MGVVPRCFGSWGALILYVLSRLGGLPGYEHAVGRWFGPLAIISFVVEVVFLALFFVAVSPSRG